MKKPGLDVNSPSNYRPISNLNNISKILERLFLSRLNSHVIKSPHFNHLQSAYRKMHSCETALCKTLNDIYLSSDNGKCTILISLDLSAAFDTIDHTILLNRLSTRFGITGLPLAWLTSYLSARTHSVCVGNSFSPITDCRTGVPQGSVLGPILFCLYISPIADIASQYGVSLQQYADDTQLYIACSVDDAASALSILESCLASLHSWFCHNGLALNPSKSEAILLGTRQRLSSFPILVGIQTANSSVPISDHITTLGVTLDSNLTLNGHVSSVCKSSYYSIKALRHIRPVLTLDMARAVAASLTQTRLDFANPVLLGISSSNINKLQRVQNCLARVVLLDQSSPSTSLLSQLHWLPVPKRIEFKIATLTYQSVTFGQPTYLSSLLTPYQPHRSLRSVSQNLLTVPRCNSSFGQRSFSYSAPRIWNGLPLAVRQSPSLDSFKRNLKTYYFASQ